MITEVDGFTALVVMLKVAKFAPAGTVTELGTEATLGLLLLMPILYPPAGAEPVKLTVPTAVPPPATEPG